MVRYGWPEAAVFGDHPPQHTVPLMQTLVYLPIKLGMPSVNQKA